MANIFRKGGKKNWIQNAVNPEHRGFCTPMTKSTCTPRRKAFARTMKKHHGFHQEGGTHEQQAYVNMLQSFEGGGGYSSEYQRPRKRYNYGGNGFYMTPDGMTSMDDMMAQDNTVVPDGYHLMPDGTLMLNEEMGGYGYYQTGGLNPPIYTQDPRLVQDYQDSARLANASQGMIDRLKAYGNRPLLPSEISRAVNQSYKRADEKAYRNLGFPKPIGAQIFPAETKKFRQRPIVDYDVPIFQQPVQPYILGTPPVAAYQLGGLPVSFGNSLGLGDGMGMYALDYTEPARRRKRKKVPPRGRFDDVMYDNGLGFYQGGGDYTNANAINTTGYTTGTSTADRPFNIIPGSPNGTMITTDNMNQSIYANGRLLRPNTGNVFFPQSAVFEEPALDDTAMGMTYDMGENPYYRTGGQPCFNCGGMNKGVLQYGGLRKYQFQGPVEGETEAERTARIVSQNLAARLQAAQEVGAAAGQAAPAAGFIGPPTEEEFFAQQDATGGPNAAVGHTGYMVPVGDDLPADYGSAPATYQQANAGDALEVAEQEQIDSMSFGRAFASERAKGKKTFIWRGNVYTTRTAAEEKASKKNSEKTPSPDYKYAKSNPALERAIRAMDMYSGMIPSDISGRVYGPGYDNYGRRDLSFKNVPKSKGKAVNNNNTSGVPSKSYAPGYSAYGRTDMSSYLTNAPRMQGAINSNNTTSNQAPRAQGTSTAAPAGGMSQEAKDRVNALVGLMQAFGITENRHQYGGIQDAYSDPYLDDSMVPYFDTYSNPYYNSGGVNYQIGMQSPIPTPKRKKRRYGY